MKMMTRGAAALLAAVLLPTAANAASMINANGTVTLEAGDTPFSFTVDYGAAAFPGLDGLGRFTFTGTSGGNSQYNFSFTITNQSTTASRLTVFGFDTDRNIVGGGITGDDFDTIVLNPAAGVPGVGTVDICFKNAGPDGNCTNGQTGGTGGLARGDSATGTFSLNFGAGRNTLTLEDFFVRFQSVGANDDNATGVGAVRNVPVTSPVPEPATWAMMIGGFGLIGGVMRRRSVKFSALA